MASGDVMVHPVVPQSAAAAVLGGCPADGAESRWQAGTLVELAADIGSMGANPTRGLHGQAAGCQAWSPRARRVWWIRRASLRATEMTPRWPSARPPGSRHGRASSAGWRTRLPPTAPGAAWLALGGRGGPGPLGVGGVDGDVQAGVTHGGTGGGEAAGVAHLGPDRHRGDRADPKVRGSQRPAARLAAGEAGEVGAQRVQLAGKPIQPLQPRRALLLQVLIQPHPRPGLKHVRRWDPRLGQVALHQQLPQVAGVGPVGLGAALAASLGGRLRRLGQMGPDAGPLPLLHREGYPALILEPGEEGPKVATVGGTTRPRSTWPVTTSR